MEQLWFACVMCPLMISGPLHTVKQVLWPHCTAPGRSQAANYKQNTEMQKTRLRRQHCHLPQEALYSLFSQPHISILQSSCCLVHIAAATTVLMGEWTIVSGIPIDLNSLWLPTSCAALSLTPTTVSPYSSSTPHNWLLILTHSSLPSFPDLMRAFKKEQPQCISVFCSRGIIIFRGTAFSCCTSQMLQCIIMVLSKGGAAKT